MASHPRRTALAICMGNKIILGGQVNSYNKFWFYLNCETSQRHGWKRDPFVTGAQFCRTTDLGHIKSHPIFNIFSEFSYMEHIPHQVLVLMHTYKWRS